MYKCEICNKEFETFQAKANHVRWTHKDNSEYKKHARKAFFEKVDEQKYGKRIETDIICAAKNCNNLIHIEYREGHRIPKTFCCKSCANTERTLSKESKNKISDKIKLAWKNGIYDTDSYNEAQSKNKKFTSKKEREIVQYFKMKFPEHEWKSGGNLKYKNTGLCRDLYSNVLKICFEYDGIWHFKDINGQLTKKQFKDKLLEEWCLENNYRLIRVDEKDYKDFKQIEDLIFKNNEPIIKIGKRY